MEKVKYVQEISLDKLELEVNDYISKGWELFERVYIDRESGLYVQMLVMHKKSKVLMEGE